jgi:hypothetical protein
MLLNYLYSNFLEEGAFAAACGTSRQDLTDYIEARIFPAPSYVYESKGRSVSFVSDVVEDVTYRFHLKGHSEWLTSITRLGLMAEDRARAHFFNRYTEAKETFLTSDLGNQLATIAPQIPSEFDADHSSMTWKHFLSGVYGVCTRDGQPESVFLKQAGVMFVEHMISEGPGSLSDTQLKLLKRTVDFLDAVESEFAPHEAPQASRQRCIVDVNAKFFNRLAA